MSIWLVQQEDCSASFRFTDSATETKPEQLFKALLYIMKCPVDVCK